MQFIGAEKRKLESTSFVKGGEEKIPFNRNIFSLRLSYHEPPKRPVCLKTHTIKIATQVRVNRALIDSKKLQYFPFF